MREVVENENMFPVTQIDMGDNVTMSFEDIAIEDVFMEDTINLVIMSTILFLVFIISVSINTTILLAFYRKQSLRTISIRCMFCL